MFNECQYTCVRVSVCVYRIAQQKSAVLKSMSRETRKKKRKKKALAIDQNEMHRYETTGNRRLILETRRLYATLRDTSRYESPRSSSRPR